MTNLIEKEVFPDEPDQKSLYESLAALTDSRCVVLGQNDFGVLCRFFIRGGRIDPNLYSLDQSACHNAALIWRLYMSKNSNRH